MGLDLLGWRPGFEPYYLPYRLQGLQVGRVVEEHRYVYTIMTGAKRALQAAVSGKFRYASEHKRDYPVVGDWVVYRQAEDMAQGTIHAVIPRFSQVSRKAAGNVTEEQVLVANIDTLFLVNSCTHDFNLRRLERYLVMAQESGAAPVIILNKADQCEDTEQKISQVQQIAANVPVHAISAAQQIGIDVLAAYCRPGQTIAMLGSSGVGKSTLANTLSEQERMSVGAVRAHDGLGQHTTTHRQLIMLPRGGMIIDTPGLRELQMWKSTQMDYSFQDIQDFAVECKYRDCLHQGEPGCGVQQAIQSGELSSERFGSYVKLTKELQHLELKDNKREQLVQKEKRKKLFQAIDRRKRS